MNPRPSRLTATKPEAKKSRLLAKVSPICALVFLTACASFAQQADQDFNRELDQESPQQLKQEAQKPDTKASACDLAKATQNPVASLISVPIQNFTDFSIGPFDRNRNTTLQFQPVIPPLALRVTVDKSRYRK